MGRVFVLEDTRFPFAANVDAAVVVVVSAAVSELVSAAAAVSVITV